MRRTIQVLSLFSILFFAFGGCNSIGQMSPPEVVIAAYMAANQGIYSEAEKYLSSAVINAVKTGWATDAGGLKGVWDRVTRNGTIDRIEILKEEIRGEGATVYFRIHFKDGATKNEDEPLIKENGQWKITLG